MPRFLKGCEEERHAAHTHTAFVFSPLMVFTGFSQKVKHEITLEIHFTMKFFLPLSLPFMSLLLFFRSLILFVFLMIFLIFSSFAPTEETKSASAEGALMTAAAVVVVLQERSSSGRRWRSTDGVSSCH